MNDKTTIVVTVVGSAVGLAALLLTVMTLLIGSVNTRIDDLQGTMNARFGDLQGTMNARFDDLQGTMNGRIDDTNSRLDDLNDRMTGVENGMRELRSLLIEALKAEAAANDD